MRLTPEDRELRSKFAIRSLQRFDWMEPSYLEDCIICGSEAKTSLWDDNEFWTGCTNNHCEFASPIATTEAASRSMWNFINMTLGAPASLHAMTALTAIKVG